MKQYIKVENGKGKIGIGLNCLLFDDQGYFIIYAPSLNISAYGSNLKEAQEMFKVVIDDFCDSFYRLSEAERAAEVKKYGWHRNPIFKKKFEISNTFIDREGLLKNFELSEDTKVQEQFLTFA